ncbi:MAG: type I DNA topoisomerase [Alphaproteobacteria bacterium]
MSGEKIVIVESPAKAKTINKYLGDDYLVLASFGHVRDLPAKDGSVRPEEGFAMSWEQADRQKKAMDAIFKAARKATSIYLATDPDREGEAISWHLSEMLKEKKLLDKKELARVTFNEITKKAVLEAFKQARQVNGELVDAYMARRALDYLVGFTLSPILWRKLPGSRSAGRVQSVALRLVCDREAEIEAFRAQEYWTVIARMDHASQPFKEGAFAARLVSLDGKKLEKFTLSDQGSAAVATKRVEGADFSIKSVEKKPVKRNPYPPFITSTLQQEASRKLGFSASRTMRLAQTLYEGIQLSGETVGLITYMRTDGVQLSGEAITACREMVAKNYGAPYLPTEPRVYKSQAKNAQEAHEAIRPTAMNRTPDSVAPYMEKDLLRLYTLIWQRTLACQMASAQFEQTSVDIQSACGLIGLRASGQVLQFDGFLRVYREVQEDEKDENAEDRLPILSENMPLKQQSVTPEQHFTEPPPRFTEASLVKKLEEMGIGRPSTYASIIQVLQDREYVRLDKKRFYPEDRGRLVTTFLVNFFKRYVEYGFTADLEKQLDEVSAGALNWKILLENFWKAFSASISEAKELSITAVIDALDADLAPYLYPDDGSGRDVRQCPSCAEGRLSLKLGKFGAFLGCSRYPDCKHTKPLALKQEAGDAELVATNEPKLLGYDAAGLPVTVRRGPYGPYVQLGPLEAPAQAAEAAPAIVAEEEETAGKKAKKAPKKEKPLVKRASITKPLEADSVTLEQALSLLTLPRPLGRHPETGEDISAGIGRFGPYLKHGSAYTSLPKDDDVLTIGMNRAVDVLAEAAKKKANAKTFGGGGFAKKAAPKKANNINELEDADNIADLPTKKVAAKKAVAKAVKKPASKTVKKAAVSTHLPVSEAKIEEKSKKTKKVSG